ncbi:hypothetical protein BD289DRAFT_439772, partial [Coniella lustricola]
MRIERIKKLWCGKITRVIRRGLDSVEELDRVEREEAKRKAAVLEPVGPLPKAFPKTL